MERGGDAIPMGRQHRSPVHVWPKLEAGEKELEWQAGLLFQLLLVTPGHCIPGGRAGGRPLSCLQEGLTDICCVNQRAFSIF